MPIKAGSSTWLLIGLTILQSSIVPTHCQKGNFRPYNPIQNIFDSFFHGPPPPNHRGPILVNQRRQQTQQGSPNSAPTANGASSSGSGSQPLIGAPNQNNNNLNQQQQQQQQQQSQQNAGPHLPSTIPAPGNSRPPSQAPRKNGDGGLQLDNRGNDQQQPLPPKPQLPPLPPGLRHPRGPRPKPPPLHAPRKPLPVLGLRQRPNGRGVPPLRHLHRPNHPGIHPLSGAFIGSGPRHKQPSEFGGSHSLPQIHLANPPPLDLVTAPGNGPFSPPISTPTTGNPDGATITVIDELKKDVPSLATPTVTPSFKPSVSTPLETVATDTPDVTQPPNTITFINDSPFEAPQVDFPDLSGNGVEQETDANNSGAGLEPNFQVKPRGHSRPVVISKIPVAVFQGASQRLKEAISSHTSEEERDEFYFVNANANQHNHKDSSPSHKQPRYIRDFQAAESSHHYSSHHYEGDHASHDHDTEAEVDLSAQGSSNSLDLTERVDRVRELVDCGGSDLGFCDMSSKYPGHMMGNLMSECQQLVYSGFVPVPEDLEELGDSNPVAKYSNASRSSVRAQTGSWSWKPYTYKKKQVCDSELRFIRPGYAKDATGKWQVIVQTEALPQRVAIDLCHAPLKPCHLMSDCGRKSRCIQRYGFQHLLAVDPENLHHCPTIRAFKFPSACVCHIEIADFHDGL